MTADLLSGTAAIILSLVFSYVPGLNTWYAALQKELKQVIMLGLVVLVAAAAYGLACAGVLADVTGIPLTCDQAGLLGLVRAVVVAIGLTHSAVRYWRAPIRHIPSYQIIKPSFLKFNFYRLRL